MIRIFTLLGVCLCTWSAVAFEAHEWLILVQDANTVGGERVHLPRFIDSRRPRAVGDGAPPPSGGILWDGELPDMIDAVIKLPEKTAISASWPAGKTRDSQISWPALESGAKPVASGIGWWDALAADRPARGANGAFASFLYYEAEADLSDRYQLARRDDALALTVAEHAPPPGAVVLLARTATGWASAKAEANKGLAPTGNHALADVLRPLLDNRPPRLATHVVDTVAHALTDAKFAAVAVLPDDFGQCEVLPLPDRHTHTRLAVFVWRESPKTADWQTLVSQLGHPDWSTREQASAQLADAGKAAAPILIEALKNPSLEIRYRAENLLIHLNIDPDKPQADPKAKPAGRQNAFLNDAIWLE